MVVGLEFFLHDVVDESEWGVLLCRVLIGIFSLPVELSSMEFMNQTFQSHIEVYTQIL